MERQEKHQWPHTYVAIDLKSFYASVECVERGLDPLTTNLVVADLSRTEKTICLAVSPSLKELGISGRARLFEVVQRVKEVNCRRQCMVQGGKLTGASVFRNELTLHPELAVDYIVAPPRMGHYIKHSTEIYQIYLKYLAPEDVHVYSIDEVFLDVTQYLETYGMTARELTMTIIRDVLEQTGITATAGIGSNLYLCKIAMDIVAKHVEADADGVRIAQLDEMTYRDLLWDHRPLTDFWRIGKGYARRLEAQGIYTMGDIARCSIGKAEEFYNEELLYQMFGVNAELLIDHAWGWEPCTLSEIRAYRPESSSFTSGQVLQRPYTFQEARLVVQEMADAASLDLVEKQLMTDQLVLTVGYDIENLLRSEIRRNYRGPVVMDPYGRQIPKHAHGTVNLKQMTSSSRMMTEAVLSLYDKIVNRGLLIRRLTLAINHVTEEGEVRRKQKFEQLDLFTDYEAREREEEKQKQELEKERKMQEAMISIKKKFGKNAILKGMNLEKGATGILRNEQIGGHKV